MKTTLSTLLLISAALCSLSCNAGEWHGDGSLGYNSISGSSRNTSLSLGLDGTYQAASWQHSVETEAYRARNGEEKAGSYGIKLQSGYDLNTSTFAFGQLRYLDDRYSGYAYQASLSLGAGRTFFDHGNNRLNGQIGLGYRTSEPNSDQQTLEKEPVGTARIIYNKDLTTNTVLKTKWSAETGADNTYLEGSVALLVAMTDALGFKFSYITKHNTRAPTGRKNTDRHTNFSLNYVFK